MTKRRTLTTAFKKKVALAALRGDQSIQELAGLCHVNIFETKNLNFG